MEALESSTPSPLESNDPRVLRGVRSIVCITREFERICRDVGVSLPQYRLLLFLRQGPERAGELASMVAIKRPTLTALVNGLEKDNRLRRVADREDGRGVRVELTAEGLKALHDVERKLGAMFDRLCASGDRDLVLSAMDGLSDTLDSDIGRSVCRNESPGLTNAAD